jgi:hypothetical protein
VEPSPFGTPFQFDLFFPPWGVLFPIPVLACGGEGREGWGRAGESPEINPFGGACGTFPGLRVSKGELEGGGGVWRRILGWIHRLAADLGLVETEPYRIKNNRYRER